MIIICMLHYLWKLSHWLLLPAPSRVHYLRELRPESVHRHPQGSHASCLTGCLQLSRVQRLQPLLLDQLSTQE